MSRSPFAGLRFYLITLVLLALIPSLGLMFQTAFEIRQREMAHLEADALQLVHVIAIQEQELINNTRQLLIALTHVPEVKNGDSQACDAFFADLLTHYPLYANLGLISRDGIVTCSGAPTESGLNLSDRDYFQQALDSGEFSQGEYQIDPVADEAVIPFAYPVLNGYNQVEAVVYALRTASWLNRVETEVEAQLSPGATLTKVDTNGVVLVREPDAARWAGQSALDTALVQTVLQHEQGIAHTVGLDGTSGIYAFAPLPGARPGQGIYVILGIPRDAAIADSNRLWARSLLGLGLVMVVVLAATWVMGNVLILRPVEDLLWANRQLAGGQLNARVDSPNKPREFAQLGAALNEMAGALEQRDGDLRLVVERLGILHEMDGAILEAKSPEEIAYAALSRITQIIRCVRGCVVTFEFETHEAVFLAFYVNGETWPGEAERVSLEALADVEFETLRRGEVHLLQNARSLCQPSAIGQVLRMHVPMILHDGLIGSLNLELDEPESLTPDHVRIASEVADSLAVAIQSVRLLEEVRMGRERLRVLSHRLIDVQEVERRYIAHELHDEIGQTLTSVKINLQTVQRLNDSATLATHLEDGIRIVERALHQVRDLSLDLRPSLLDDLGLVPALRWLVDRLGQRAGFSTSFRFDPIQPQISPDVEVACYRVVQETLTNVTRHAQARHVSVELQVDRQELHVLISDDGAGFDVKAALDRAARGGSLGLLGMEERAMLVGGRLVIISTPGQGTEVSATFPLVQGSTRAEESQGEDMA